MKKYKVGVIGATGMVGQRFVTLMQGHPWFTLTVVAASPRSAGKRYADVMEGRWQLETPLPDCARDLIVMDATADAEKIAGMVDFVFSAVDMKKDEIQALEERYAKLECPVVSNNSAHRWTPDVPMVVPEINPEHILVIESQRKRLGTKRGFIAVKSNCSLQSYVPALNPLRDFGLEKVLVCTYQAISGAGKNFSNWPEMVGNLIPFISGEEEKSEKEPLRIFGHVEPGKIVPATEPVITCQCLRVPILYGHTAAAFVKFRKKPASKEELIAKLRGFRGVPQEKALPSAPKQFIQYLEEDDRPQITKDVNYERGMGVSIGRLRKDTVYDWKFVGLSHNTLRGAAGGAVEFAELLVSQNYIAAK